MEQFYKGDPQILGVPIFVVGSVALGLALIGYVPGQAVGGVLPILMAATGLGLLIATVWAIQLGQTFVAAVFGIFLGFWWSYPLLVLGLTHGWFAIPEDAVTKSVATFLIAWLVIIFLLTVASVPLPSVYTILLAVVCLALVLIIWGTLDANTTLTKAGGWAVLGFAAIGGYIFMSVASLSLGGRGLPMGRPFAAPRAELAD